MPAAETVDTPAESGRGGLTFPDAPWNFSFFTEAVEQVAAHKRFTGRWPDITKTDGEEVLAKFLYRERRAYRGVVKAKAPTSKTRRALLDQKLPGWDDPVGPGRGRPRSWDDTTGDRGYRRFADKVVEIADFVRLTGRFPVRKVVSEETLAKFLAVQRSAYMGIGTGDTTPTKARQRLLDEMLPGWSRYKGKFFSDLDEAHRARLGKELVEFVVAHLRMPRLDVPGKERELALFVQRDEAQDRIREAPMTAEEVDSIRMGLGLSIKDLAEQLGITVSAVYRWQNGERSPNPQSAEAMRHLQLLVVETVEDLAGRELSVLDLDGGPLPDVPRGMRMVIASRLREQLPGVRITGRTSADNRDRATRPPNIFADPHGDAFIEM